MYTMVDKIELGGYKKTVQNIVDKYLPKDKKISVKDFTEEQLWYFCSLITEGDSKKRQVILNEIKDKSNKAEYDFYTKYNETLRLKESLETYIKTVDDLNTLYNAINIEREMDVNLNNLNS